MCSTQLVPYQRMQILGTKGRIEVEIPFNAPPDKPCRIFVDDGSALGDASAKEEAFPVCDQYGIQGDLFSEAIRSGKPPEFPLENAVQNMRIIDAIFRSAKTGGWERYSLSLHPDRSMGMGDAIAIEDARLAAILAALLALCLPGVGRAVECTSPTIACSIPRPRRRRRAICRSCSFTATMPPPTTTPISTTAELASGAE